MTDIANGEINEEATPEDGASQGKGGRGKLIIIGAIALVLLLAAGAGGWFLMQPDSEPVEEDATQAIVKEPFFYELPEIMVNLNTGGAAAEFLKLSIALEVEDQSMISVIEPRMPRVLDAFQVYLRELRREDLEGSAGIYRLKEELQRRVNLAVYPASVENILFKEILIQ